MNPPGGVSAGAGYSGRDAGCLGAAGQGDGPANRRGQDSQAQAIAIRPGRLSNHRGVDGASADADPRADGCAGACYSGRDVGRLGVAYA
eukprot:SAG22_NODE_2461_length_2544_cov_2.351329_1_plen_89_part_00